MKKRLTLSTRSEEYYTENLKKFPDIHPECNPQARMELCRALAMLTEVGDILEAMLMPSTPTSSAEGTATEEAIIACVTTDIET